MGRPDRVWMLVVAAMLVGVAHGYAVESLRRACVEVVQREFEWTEGAASAWVDRHWSALRAATDAAQAVALAMRRATSDMYSWEVAS